MAHATKLTTLLTVLAVSACGDGREVDDRIIEAGPGRQDASTGVDSGQQSDAGGGSSEAGASDAQSHVDTGASDAGASDAGASDAASGDGGMDASSSALAFAQGGSVSVLDGGTSNAKGAALLVRTDAGHTLVSLQVSGLNPDKMYPAHVHNLPCSMQAGGHYQHTTDGGVNATNEVWPVLMTNDAGQGRSFVDVDKVLRSDAVAVVVHDPDAANAKLLCADLTSASLSAFATNGTLTRFGAATDAGAPNLSGNGNLTRSSNGTTSASIDLQNLKPNTMYMVHVHDQPCAFASGGGHYKIDYGVDAAVASNELWLDVTSNDAGAGKQDASINHIARAEAQAIVVHAMDNTRLGCIDLKP
jgi:hypothetical protein